MKRMSRMEGEKPTLMIIPMIDIIFFLLVFFMISTIYTIPQQSLSIMLPKTKTQQSAELRPVLIDFEKSGQLMIDDGYVTKEQLISSVKAKIGENKNLKGAFHNFVENVFDTSLSSENSDIMKRIFLANNYDTAFENDIREIGLSHILAVSGLHIGIIYLILSKILIILPIKRISLSLQNF